MNRRTRKARNEVFLRHLLARRPQYRERYAALLDRPPVRESALESAGDGAEAAREMALETIVFEERPVLFVRDGGFDTTEVTIIGDEAKELVRKMTDAGARLRPHLPLIGRIDVENFPNVPFVGTGWFVDQDIVVTNRHVASLIAQWDGRQFVFSRGIGGRAMAASLNNAHEYDDDVAGADRVFKITEVLYIEPELGANDIAFVRVARRPDGIAPGFIPIAPADVAANVPVCVVGYPARAPRRVIPDQALMERLYRDRFDVKRAAPGYTMSTESGSSRHDCTTLGGNSGSVVLDLATGDAVGLHFSGLYQEANYAVRASTLREYVRRKRWNRPPEIEARPAAGSTAPATPPTAPAPPVAAIASCSAGAVTVTIPLTISISLGAPTAGQMPAGGGSSGGGDSGALSAARVEQAVSAYWRARPDGVLAARVGYVDDGDRIGEQPCIAVSVRPDRWGAFEETGARDFDGVPIRYLPAEVGEQLDAMPALEAVDSVAYDDDARGGSKFSFAPVEEEMDVLLHVGPEYSWDVLSEFLEGADGSIVSAMYEFHAPHIKDALEARLDAGASLTLVLDNASFSKFKGESDEFDRIDVFEDWAESFDFKRIVAPEGGSGLIANSYHIKVTVRQDDTFWLSSGNWKMGSSQPVITAEERELADNGDADLRGNREWHVVIKSPTLATRFRSHILQDFRRSKDLGAGPLPKSMMEEETFVDVPLEEAPVLERRPPSHILEPRRITGPIKVQPLLTPDREGAVFCEAVLRLIRSAKKSLLFQIPYIGMPPSPQADRGFIDELIGALTEQLKTLDDARVILRSGSKRYSSPVHAAWYFKSKGVDIDACLRVIDDHHTKGMIVDGRRVLVGSHNWSAPGVTLNRDASLIFDDERAASYYAEAFEIDWKRSNKIKPKRFVMPEGPVLEAVGAGPPPGYVRVPLSEWLKDD